MDFAFAPGQEFDDLRTVLSRRKNTTVVSPAGVTNIADFFANLQTNHLKGGDLIIGSHGTDEGQLLIALDSHSNAQTTFDSLQSNTSIVIPASIKSADTSVHLFGCLIGSPECLPFLKLLKQKLGNPKALSAPQYVHATHSIDAINFFELMRYDFRILRKKKFDSYDLLVNAFKTAGFKYLIDNTDIPPANWATWIPSAADLTPTTLSEIAVAFPVKINPAVGNVGTLTDQMATWISALESFPEGGIPMTKAIPNDNDEAGKAAFAKEALGKDPGFGPISASNPYPVYKRFHLNSLQEFADGWNWKITPGAKAGTADFMGTRFRYEILVPITKSGASTELIFNYYPSTGDPTINFKEDDPKLFSVV